MSSVPLICKICPKRPKFSDISHLLTHVASKGHLSHYFKVQVRSSHDENAFGQLQEYDLWYEKNHIERLLAQRMATKDAKPTSSNIARHTNTSMRQPQADRRTKVSVPTAVITRQHENEATSTTPIDPQLAAIGQVTKIPSFGQSTSSPESSSREQPASASQPSMPVLSMTRPRTPCKEHQRRSDTSPYPQTRHHPVIDNESQSCYNPHDHDNILCEEDQKKSQHKPHMHYPSSNTSPRSTVHNDFSQVRPYLVKEEEESDPIPLIKLKGPQWPGMALFDSASPETQRKRNQKKDVIVLGQMQKDSLDIEQVEKIYFPDGSLKKERRITGVVESSSPIKIQSPKPKRRRGRRAALTDVDSNVPRAAGSTSRTKTATMAQNKHPRTWAICRNPSRSQQPKPHNPEDDPIGVSSNTDVDWILDMGASEYSSRRKLAVYRDDASQPDPQEKIDMQRDIVSPVESPTLDFREDAYCGAGTFAPQVECVAQCPSNTSRLLSFTRPKLRRSVDGGQNGGRRCVAPMLSSKQSSAVTPDPSFEERTTQRYFAVTADGRSQFFHHAPMEMTFRPFEMALFQGQTVNPLNRNLQQQTAAYQGHSTMYTGVEGQRVDHRDEAYASPKEI